jgi:flagellar hook assembly protein FlgD
MAAGTHTLTWDGRDEHGSQVANGVYFCELRAGTNASRQRMVLLR